MIQTQLSYLPSDTIIKTEFPRWILEHCDATSVVLDVGAGKGRTGHAAVIRPNVGRIAGVDPDGTILENPFLDECYQSSIEDFAQRKEEQASFDCLYTTSVLEHVTRPHAFLSACKSLLKPNGTFFSVTPNLWHYFGMTTKVCSSLGIEDWLLDRLVGVQAKSAYHFPTAYRLNSMRTIKRVLAETGFREVEFRFLDPPRNFFYLLPKALWWFPRLYSKMVYSLRIPPIMGLIMFRATA